MARFTEFLRVFVDARARPFGVVVLGRPDASAVCIDELGELWRVAAGERSALVSWLVRGNVRVYHSIGELSSALAAGHVVGVLSHVAPGFNFARALL